MTTMCEWIIREVFRMTELEKCMAGEWYDCIVYAMLKKEKIER